MYICTMEKNQQQQDQSFWENEVRYFEDAQDALKKCFAIISSLKDHALSKLKDYAPSSEEVEV